MLPRGWSVACRPALVVAEWRFLRAELGMLLRRSVVDCIDHFFVVGVDEFWRLIDHVYRRARCLVDGFSIFVKEAVSEFDCCCAIKVLGLVVDGASNLGGEFPEDHFFE